TFSLTLIAVPTVEEILKRENIDATCSETHKYLVITGGLAGGVLFIVTTASIIAVVFVLKCCRARSLAPKTRHVKYSVQTHLAIMDQHFSHVVTQASQILLMLFWKDETYEEPKFETTTNQAYNVVKENEGGTEDVGYTTPDTNYMNTVSLSKSAECIPSVEDSIYEN
ncbi:hypothetical protein GBAR_LOCUS20969, partial [Geodia barretti]